MYGRLADRALDYLCSEFEALGEALIPSKSPSPASLTTGMKSQYDMTKIAASFDVQMSMGVLKLVLGPEIGTYVVNKQPPNLQLWLSSPLSYHTLRSHAV